MSNVLFSFFFFAGPIVNVRIKRASATASDYLNAASSLDSRIQTVLAQLHKSIPIATDSVEADIAVANRDRIILGLANLFGSEYC